MSSRLKATCSHCLSVLTLKDERAVGKRVKCPRCSEPFVVEITPEEDEFIEEYDEFVDEGEWESDDYSSGNSDGWDEADAWDAEPAPRRSRPAGSSGRSRRQVAASSKSKPVLLIGGAIAVAAVLVIAVVGMLAQGGGNANGLVGGPQAGGPASGSLPASALPSSNETFTVDELTEFGQRIAALTNERNAAQLSSLFNMDAFIDRALLGFELPERDTAGFKMGFRTTILHPTGMIGSITASVSDGGAAFMRVREIDSEQRVLLRVIQEAGSVAYLEFVPVRGLGGQLQFSDYFNYMVGDLVSQTVRAAAIPAFANQNKSFLERLTGADREAADYLKQLEQLGRLRQTGQHAAVLSRIQQLPEATRQQKVFLLLRLQMAMEIDSPDYVTAMEEFRRVLPNDPAIDFISIDYYFAKEEHQNCIACLQRAEDVLGGDAYFHALRGAVQLLAGDVAGARTVIDEAIAMEPALQFPHVNRLDVLVAQKDYDELLSEMKLLGNEYELVFPDLSIVPEFADFLTTPQHAQYKEFLKDFQLID
jgi:tetratricopeptide (TPR) repeat protein